MSNPDSFIDEVTEEVRRDRLYGAFRKYGWIGGLVVLAIVGGTAVTEWKRFSGESAAQLFGDALTDALDLGAPEDRRAAISAIPASGAQIAVKELMLASDPEEDKAATLASLDVLIGDASQPQVYRDLATLKKVLVAGADMTVADRRAALEPLTAPGRAFRPLALEQMAYLLIEEGKTDAAITALQPLMQDQQSPRGLRARVQQAIITLGGSVDPAQAG